MRHTETETQTNRRAYLKSVGAVSAAGMVGLSGCAGSGNDATGTLATEVTDQPGDIADFESCIVTIAGIWVKPAGDDESGDADTTETDAADDGVTEQTEDDVDQSDGRQYYQFEEAQEADLVELQDGNTKLVDEREMTAQTYEFLQLDVTGVEGTLDGGEEATVETPGNAPLQFKEEFEIREDEMTTFVGDFTPVKRGQTNRYLLQPVASGTEVRYEGA
ncbi:MAG: DUF4382 domain-containing protein [Haloarculaceae archaeon]